METRRVVTGRTSDGTSVIAIDGPAPRAHDYLQVPGLSETLVWATEPGPGRALGAEVDPTLSTASYVPSPGATRLIVLRFPPDSVFTEAGFDAAAARAEQLACSPGLGALFEEAAPGMHTTETLDYAVVLDGELYLELDAGAQTRLLPGDVVVQTGTRHAWRNHSDAPATLLVVLVGVAS